MKDKTDYQKIRNSSKKVRPSVIFTVVSLIGMASVLLVIYFSHGEMIELYLFHDTIDTGMDFFNSVAHMRWKEVFSTYQTLYPPLANLLYRTIFRMIPSNLTTPWDEYYADRTDFAARGSGYDLRVHQAPMVAFLLLTVLSALLASLLVRRVLKDKSDVLKESVALASAFSFPFVYAYDRGNIVIICWCFTMAFLLLYDHRNKALREVGLISLAFAAGIKLYPALFGIVLLQEKRYRDAIRTIIYGILSVWLPLLCLGEGLNDLKAWFGVLTGSPFATGTAYFLIAPNVVFSELRATVDYFGFGLPAVFWKMMGLLLCAFLLIGSFFCQERWRRVLHITLSMLLLFPQYEYAQCFFLIPLLLLFKEDDCIRQNNIVCLVCMMIYTVNIPIFTKTGLIFWYRSFLYGLTLKILVIACVWESLQGMLSGHHLKLRQVGEGG